MALHYISIFKWNCHECNGTLTLIMLKIRVSKSPPQIQKMYVYVWHLVKSYIKVSSKVLPAFINLYTWMTTHNDHFFEYNMSPRFYHVKSNISSWNSHNVSIRVWMVPQHYLQLKQVLNIMCYYNITNLKFVCSVNNYNFDVCIYVHIDRKTQRLVREDSLLLTSNYFYC